jgi:hypothetical protein
MKRTILVSFASATVMFLAMGGAAFAAHHSAGHAVAPAAAAHPHPMAIAGRIVAVRRLSQVISVQTPTGEIREVKVPNTAAISGHGVNRFSSVRAGQSVHVMAVRNESQGLVAHSVSVP